MNDKLTAIVDKLKWQTQSWSSLECDITRKTVKFRSQPNERLTELVKYKYIENTDKQVLVDQVHFNQAQAEILHQKEVFDGKVGSLADYTPKNQKKPAEIFTGLDSFGAIDPAGGNARPEPFRFLSVGKFPLVEALSKASIKSTTQILARPCHVVVFSDVRVGNRSGSMEYSLDEQTGLPLRVSFGTSEQPGLWLWEATSIKEVQGYFVVDKSFSISPTNPDLKIPVSKDEFHVENIVFNKTHSDSLFELSKPPGALIQDIRHPKELPKRVPGGKQKTPELTKSEATTKTEAAIQLPAVPKHGWAPTSISALVLSVGVCALVTAWVFRRRT